MLFQAVWTVRMAELEREQRAARDAWGDERRGLVAATQARDAAFARAQVWGVDCVVERMLCYTRPL